MIEQFICGKAGDLETCEDGIVIGKELIAVIDGVTSKGERSWNGESSGYFAKEQITEYLLRNDAAKEPAGELFRHLNELLGQGCQGISCKEYPRAAVILYNDYYKEVWSYGDCQCMIGGKVYTHEKKIDQLNADLRAFRLEYALLRGEALSTLMERDTGRAFIQESLMMQFAFENEPGPFGYPVLNGQKINEDMIVVYPVKEGEEVVLASDGYPILRHNLKASEYELGRILREDPFCFRTYRATKGLKEGNVSFDDRSYCRFIV